jgi:hypothetical protein
VDERAPSEWRLDTQRVEYVFAGGMKPFSVDERAGGHSLEIVSEDFQDKMQYVLRGRCAPIREEPEATEPS